MLPSGNLSTLKIDWHNLLEWNYSAIDYHKIIFVGKFSTTKYNVLRYHVDIFEFLVKNSYKFTYNDYLRCGKFANNSGCYLKSFRLKFQKAFKLNSTTVVKFKHFYVNSDQKLKMKKKVYQWKNKANWIRT